MKHTIVCEAREPAFCFFCGRNMNTVKEIPSRPWQGSMICDNGHVADIIYGDTMGGAPYCEVKWKKKARWVKAKWEEIE